MLLGSLETRQKESYNSLLSSHSFSMIDSNNKVSTIGGRCKKTGGCEVRMIFVPKFADSLWEKAT